MREAYRHPDQPAVHVTELDADVVTKGRRGRPDVDSHIPDATTNYADQLPLGGRMLIVQPSLDTRGGARMIVLHERRGHPMGAKALNTKPLGKEAA